MNMTDDTHRTHTVTGGVLSMTDDTHRTHTVTGGVLSMTYDTVLRRGWCGMVWYAKGTKQNDMQMIDHKVRRERVRQRKREREREREREPHI